MDNFRRGLDYHAGADAKTGLGVCMNVPKQQNKFHSFGTLLGPVTKSSEVLSILLPFFSVCSLRCIEVE
jgi:hypothetical protein